MMSFDEMTKKAIADVAIEKAFAFAVTRLFTSGKLPLEALQQLLAVSNDVCWYLKFDDVALGDIEEWLMAYVADGRHLSDHAKLAQRL
jgi:hypothetical protein